MIRILETIQLSANFLYWNGILDIITVSKQKSAIKKIEWIIENIVRITIKHLEINQILAVNNPSDVDVLLKK